MKMPKYVQKRYLPWILIGAIAAIVGTMLSRAEFLRIFSVGIFLLWGLSAFAWKDWLRVAAAVLIIVVIVL